MRSRISSRLHFTPEACRRSRFCMAHTVSSRMAHGWPQTSAMIREYFMVGITPDVIALLCSYAFSSQREIGEARRTFFLDAIDRPVVQIVAMAAEHCLLVFCRIGPGILDADRHRFRDQLRQGCVEFSRLRSPILPF